MSATYDATALGTALNEIRFRLGDTGPDFRLSDEEIEAYAPGGVLATASNTAACIALCDALIARYTGVVDVSEGGASFSGSQLAAQYTARKAQLQREGSAAISPAGAFFTGRTMEPAFTRIMGDTEYNVPTVTDESYP